MVGTHYMLGLQILLHLLIPLLQPALPPIPLLVLFMSWISIVFKYSPLGPPFDLFNVLQIRIGEQTQHPQSKQKDPTARIIQRGRPVPLWEHPLWIHGQGGLLPRLKLPLDLREPVPLRNVVKRRVLPLKGMGVSKPPIWTPHPQRMLPHQGPPIHACHI